jgi:hypothetical protein
MVGVEYEVMGDASTSDPSYFVIRKQWRESASSTRLLAAYYVVGIEPPTPHAPARGTVFPLPDLHSVFAFNLTTALFYLKHSVEAMATVMAPAAQPIAIATPPAASNASNAANAANGTAAAASSSLSASSNTNAVGGAGAGAGSRVRSKFAANNPAAKMHVMAEDALHSILNDS